MEAQKFVNLLSDSSNDKSKFATKTWYVIDSQTAKDKYNPNNSIKFEIETIKSNFCDYSDAFISVTGDMTVAANNDTHVAFKNCAPFSICKTEISDVFINEANHIYIAMPMHNLIEYSDDYADIPGPSWQFKRDEVTADNADLTVDNSQLFKYKAALVGKTANAVNNTNSSAKNTKIVVPLKYLNNFWRSLEMPLINFKIHLEFILEDCILSSAGDSGKFKITDAKLHVPIVISSIKDNVNLTKQLSN